MALIQEHFKKDGSSLFDIFGSGWWNVSSGAVGKNGGRRSGGCAIYVQPCLYSDEGFQKPGGRVCGLFTSGGLVLNAYFPTREQRQSVQIYRKVFKDFVLELTKYVEKTLSEHHVSWIVCGADLNAHLPGIGIFSRRCDDFAATQIKKFMKRFKLITVAAELSPNRYTYLNSRGGLSSIDSFLVSRDLYERGAVSMFEVVDFIEYGSDHCPIYIRLNVRPSWKKKSVLKSRRIIKKIGFESLKNRLGKGSIHRSGVSRRILNFFSDLKWAKVQTRRDMDSLWSLWVKRYKELVESLMGTRKVKDSAWGRKFDPEVRKRCKEASIARSWYIEAKRSGGKTKDLLQRWQNLRLSYVESWERSERNWNIQRVERAIALGDREVWRLLNSDWSKSTRAMCGKDGSVLIDPVAILSELQLHHTAAIKEYEEVPPVEFDPVKWNDTIKESDLVLRISDELVLDNIRKLKNTTVPDEILPKVIKLIFGHIDLVGPISEMIRAVVRTRVFPRGGKVAKQIFLWKGAGIRDSLKNCRPITMSNILLKLAESCVKVAAQRHWFAAGFPRRYWGHFFGAPESVYIWISTVEKYIRLGKNPRTALTDVSQAFNRVNHELFKRKLFDFGLPRQLIELVL